MKKYTENSIELLFTGRVARWCPPAPACAVPQGGAAQAQLGLSPGLGTKGLGLRGLGFRVSGLANLDPPVQKASNAEL